MIIIFNDFDTPVISYLDHRTIIYLSFLYSKFEKDLFKAMFYSDYFKLKYAKTDESFWLSKVISYIGSYSEDIVYDASIYLDPNKDIYKKNVFTIMDLFGVIGSIYGLLLSSWRLLVGFISHFLYIVSFQNILLHCKFKLNKDTVFYFLIK